MKWFISLLALAAIGVACYSSFQKGVGQRLPDGAWIGVPMDIKSGQGYFTGIVRVNGTNDLISQNILELAGLEGGMKTGKWYSVTLEVKETRSALRVTPVGK